MQRQNEKQKQAIRIPNRIVVKKVRKWAETKPDCLEHGIALNRIAESVRLGEISEIAGRRSADICAKLQADGDKMLYDHCINDFNEKIQDLEIKSKKSFLEYFHIDQRELQQQYAASDLMKADIPKIIFYVEGMIAPGVVILAGEPKVGKSNFALLAGNSAALGVPLLESTREPLFEGFRTIEVSVLYYSLEMAPNLIRDRLKMMYPNGGVSDKLHILFDLPRLDQGGYAVLEDDIQTYGAGIVFIDVFGLITTRKSSQNPLYEQTYNEIKPLREIAERNNCSIVLITHLNKNTDSSPFNRMMGSTAIRGASDVNIVLARYENKQTLLMLESRVSEGMELILKWNRGRFEYVSSIDDALEEKKREEYLSDPVANAIKVALTTQNRAELTATEILDLMPAWASKNYTPQKIGRHVNNLASSLKFYDRIQFSFERKENKRAYRFTKPKDAELTSILDDFLPKPKENDNNHVMVPVIEEAQREIPINGT